MCSSPRDLNNKDAVIFTLADGRVALIHRIHPDMQLAVFDDVDHLWHAPDDYWDEHVAALGEHTILTPAPGALGSVPARRRCRLTPACSSSSTSAAPTASTR